MARDNTRSAKLIRKKLVTTVADETDILKLIQLFLKFKKAQGLADRTYLDYVKTLNEFIEKVSLENPTNSKVLQEKLLEYFNFYSSKSPTTYNIKYAYINAFFNWALNNGYFESNILRETGLRKRRDDNTDIKHLSENVVEKLLKVMDVTTYTGLRDYATTILTLDTGIRPSEIFQLTEDDVHFSENYIHVSKYIAKTRTGRDLIISPQTVVILQKFLSHKPPEFGNRLFYSCEGRPMSTDSWAHRLYYYGDKIDASITPYSLRHTFAIMFLRNGGNVFALQKAMGHRRISTTEIYIRLAETDMREQHRKASPVNNFVQRTTRVRKLR